MRNYARGSRWLPGTALEETGSVLVQVDVRGTVHHRHHDHSAYIRCLELEIEVNPPICQWVSQRGERFWRLAIVIQLQRRTYIAQRGGTQLEIINLPHTSMTMIVETVSAL